MSLFSLVFLSQKDHKVVLHIDTAYDWPVPSLRQVCWLMLDHNVPPCWVVSTPPSVCHCVRRIEEERADESSDLCSVITLKSVYYCTPADQTLWSHCLILHAMFGWCRVCTMYKLYFIPCHTVGITSSELVESCPVFLYTRQRKE